MSYRCHECGARYEDLADTKKVRENPFTTVWKCTTRTGYVNTKCGGRVHVKQHG